MRLPAGFEVVATSEGAPFAVTADEVNRRYTVIFHPEVVHTPDGGWLLANLALKICGCRGDWTMAAFRSEAIEAIRKQVGDRRVICGLSGGVDSSVAAILIHEAIGEQLTCIFVDHGLPSGRSGGGRLPFPRSLQHSPGAPRRKRPFSR